MESTTLACPSCRSPLGIHAAEADQEACPFCGRPTLPRVRLALGLPSRTPLSLAGLSLAALAVVAITTVLLVQLKRSRAEPTNLPESPRQGETSALPIDVARITPTTIRHDSPDSSAGGERSFQLDRILGGSKQASSNPGAISALASSADAGAGSCCEQGCPSEAPSRMSLLGLQDAPGPGPAIAPVSSEVDEGATRSEPTDEVAPPAENASRPAPTGGLDSGKSRDEPVGEAAHSGDSADPKRVRVRDRDGCVLVARTYGGEDSGVVLLPGGRLGWPEDLAYTDEPFTPWTPEVVERSLLDGDYQGFASLRTDHYIILYRGTARFARASGSLLESLYQGLLKSVVAAGIEADEAEFPLVAIIYEDEAAFRAANDVAPNVEAYYDVVSNQIHLYETSDRDRQAPDLAARRKPQTVAHEGTHQVLQNIGVHARLASWPLWLVEGLAEFFAPTTVGDGNAWDGANHVNPFHMATIRELQDPLTVTLQQQGLTEPRLDRAPGTPLIEHLVTRTVLSPTDYALAWALTFYLINERPQEFHDYLRKLSERKITVKLTPEDHLAEFRAAFGQDLMKLDRSVGRFLGRLRNVETLVYYAVMFEQPIGPTVVRRAALVSQSPAMIMQWVEANRSARGGPVHWRAIPFPTRPRALLAADTWISQGR